MGGPLITASWLFYLSGPVCVDRAFFHVTCDISLTSNEPKVDCEATGPLLLIPARWQPVPLSPFVPWWSLLFYRFPSSILIWHRFSITWQWPVYAISLPIWHGAIDGWNMTALPLYEIFFYPPISHHYSSDKITGKIVKVFKKFTHMSRMFTLFRARENVLVRR